MIEFLKNLFSDKKVVKKEKTPLELLAYSISDIGLFTWFSADLPVNAQLEFMRTMLYFEPTDSESAPLNQIALQFKNITSLHVFREEDSKFPSNWLEYLNADRLDPFEINPDYFSFDAKEIQNMVSNFGIHKKRFGYDINNLIDTDDFAIGFKAGEVAIVLSAKKMKIMTHSGEIPIDKIPEIHKKWWTYWKQYWNLKDSKNPMPYDTLCEITIPAGK